MALFPQIYSRIHKRCNNAGERLVLEQLKRCLSDDYIVWHDIPVGPLQRQPDFVIFNPRRGVLVLEVKHWKLSTMAHATKEEVMLQLDGGPKTCKHPEVQARECALQIDNVLERDPQLKQTEGRYVGKCTVPYGWGAVMSGIRSAQVAGTDFEEVFPATRTLLVLYDDAQSIYKPAQKRFSFASVGIEAQGRTSILRLNYRNTVEILALAMQCAEQLLTDVSESDIHMQRVRPETAGRRGTTPQLLRFACDKDEANALAERIASLTESGTPPDDIAVLCRDKYHWQELQAALKRQGIPTQKRGDYKQGNRNINWNIPSVKLLTMHAAKGLEFPHVFVMRLDLMPSKHAPDEELRVLYVAMTRATQQLTLSCVGDSPLVQGVHNALEAIHLHLAETTDA